MDKTCPYCRSEHLIKNGSSYGVPKWKCKDCGRQTSFKPPRGEPAWKKDTAVLLYTLGLSMNAIAQQLGVSTPSILNWIRAHAATQAPRPQPEPGEEVVVMELDELWHFLKKKRTNSGSGWRLIALADASWTGNAAIVMPSR
jgi:transposase